MFGFFRKKQDFTDLSFKYHSILKNDFQMNELYASSLIKYKGEDFSKAEENFKKCLHSPNVSSSLKKLLKDYGVEYCSIVTVCMTVYMEEFKRGKISTREFEYAVIGILWRLKEVTERLDRLFISFIEDKLDEKWPGVVASVFTN